PKPGLPEEGAIGSCGYGTRNGMAGYRDTRVLDGRRALHSGNRKTAGIDGGLPRRNCLSLRLHFRGGCGEDWYSDAKQQLWSLPAGTSARKGILNEASRMRAPAIEPIKKIETALPDVFILEPRVFADERGFFLESYNEKVFAGLGIRDRFVQDNHSR